MIQRTGSCQEVIKSIRIPTGRDAWVNAAYRLSDWERAPNPAEFFAQNDEADERDAFG
jgi:hypothetical protein